MLSPRLIRCNSYVIIFMYYKFLYFKGFKKPKTPKKVSPKKVEVLNSVVEVLFMLCIVLC